MFRAPAFKVSVLRMAAAWLLAIGALALAAPAQAQQTFLCEDGGSVTVLPGQLELMKRTDPCVARHFQGSLDQAPEPGLGAGQGQWQGQEPASEWQAATEEPPPGSAPMEVPLPAKKPETLMAAAGGAGDAGSTAGQQKPPAEVKSDYRHVHIINAGRGAPQFYEHTR